VFFCEFCFISLPLFELMQDDRDSETTCFGVVAATGAKGDSYKAPGCWMYRSYNGYQYSNVS
jgi:hypothetical protein